MNKILDYIKYTVRCPECKHESTFNVQGKIVDGRPILDQEEKEKPRVCEHCGLALLDSEVWGNDLGLIKKLQQLMREAKRK